MEKKDAVELAAKLGAVGYGCSSIPVAVCGGVLVGVSKGPLVGIGIVVGVIAGCTLIGAGMGAAAAMFIGKQEVRKE